MRAFAGKSSVTEGVIRRKKLRALQGKPLRVLDLFSGAGGLSLGFGAEGYELLGGVEADPVAAETHATNFFGDDFQRSRHGNAHDITRLQPRDCVANFSDLDPAEAVDVIVGGPPCQAFARIGRAKLREIAAHPEAYKRDKRARLYASFLLYVHRLKPAIVVMENVPDILNYGGRNVAEEICEALQRAGYNCKYTLLNAVHYGVPQMRERLFLIAIHRDMGVPPSFPAPTHQWELPSGYGSSRKSALKNLTSGDQPEMFCSAFFTPSPEPRPGLPPAVSAEEAIGDLPRITLHLEGRMRRGAKRFNEIARYSEDVTVSGYARRMREWDGYKAGEGVYDHVIRYLPRDYPIFREMQPGDQYPEALALALRLFEEKLGVLRALGEDVGEGTVLREEVLRGTVPPYDADKFPNKWRKLEPDAPARTLTAHLGKDSYSHIHHDSDQARTISVREAARLQSFPDGFCFSGAMNSALRQIGNAVPPLLARAVGRHLLRVLKDASGAGSSIACSEPEQNHSDGAREPERATRA